MKYDPSQKSHSASLAEKYKCLNHPLRKAVISSIFRTGPLSFISLSNELETDRAKLAYHLKLLRDADLIENFYDKKEGSKSHSYYRLTPFTRWLLQNDMKLTSESYNYLSSIRKNGQSDKNISSEAPKLYSLIGIGEEEDTKIVKDPRIRYKDYRIKLKY